MYKFLGLFLIVFLVSCKSKAVLLEGEAKSKLSPEKIIANHYNNKKEFLTLYIKSSAHYEDDKQSQNVTAEIKIKKDEMILVSIRFLGITMAKALITPTEVKYYEKLGSKYFEGNFSSLSQWLGTDLDYQKVQNMLIGEALDDLKKDKFTASIVDKLYKLENKSDINITKTYFFEADQFQLKKEELLQIDEQRMMQIEYPSFINYNQLFFPSGIVINAYQKSKKTNIDIEYKTITLNEELTFPYSVPEGYDKISIN
jgi:Domain of unknown function (DUF4292)